MGPMEPSQKWVEGDTVEDLALEFRAANISRACVCM